MIIRKNCIEPIAKASLIGKRDYLKKEKSYIFIFLFFISILFNLFTMAKVQYVYFANILSRINGPTAFNFVSNGVVNVDCWRANINKSEKVAKIIHNMKAWLRTYKEESEIIATKYVGWWAERDIRMNVIMKELRAFRLDKVSESDVNVKEMVRCKRV